MLKGAFVPINRLLSDTVSPDEVKRLNLAFERTLRDLQLVDRNDPLTEIVAKKVIMVGLDGIREPAEIANCILWLASDESSFATGAMFTVDGGMSAW